MFYSRFPRSPSLSERKKSVNTNQTQYNAPVPRRLQLFMHPNIYSFTNLKILFQSVGNWHKNKAVARNDQEVKALFPSTR